MKTNTYMEYRNDIKEYYQNRTDIKFHKGSYFATDVENIEELIKQTKQVTQELSQLMKE